MFRWLANLIRGLTDRRPQPPSRLGHRFWLRMEGLEDRACPATWTDATDNHQFYDLGNWTWSASEQYGDLSMPRFTSTANGGSSDSCTGMTGSFTTISIASDYTGTITPGGPITAYMFGLNGGVFDQPSGADLTVTGWFGWTGGILNSLGTAANVNISGGTGSISPAGGGTLTTGSNIHFVSGATGMIQTGTLDLPAGLTLDVDATSQLAATGATFSSTGAPQLIVNGNASFLPDGTGRGTVFDGPGLLNQGVVALGGMVDLVRGYGIKVTPTAKLTLNDGAVVSRNPQAPPDTMVQNDGLLEVPAGQATIGVRVVNNANIELTGKLTSYQLDQTSAAAKITLKNIDTAELTMAGALTLYDGQINGPGLVRIGTSDGITHGLLDWHSPATIDQVILRITGQSRAVVSYVAFPRAALSNSTVENYGTLTVRGPFKSAASLINNWEGGVIELVRSGDWNPIIGRGGLGGITNYGTIDSGSSMFYQENATDFEATIEVGVTNFGTITVHRGDLDLYGDTLNYGLFQTNNAPDLPASVLDFMGPLAIHQFRDGTEFRGPGTVRVDNQTTFELMDVGTLRLPARFEVADAILTTTEGYTATLSATHFIWYGGTFTSGENGSLTVEAQAGNLFEITDSADTLDRVIDRAVLLNEGAVTWSSPGNVLMRNNALWCTDAGAVQIAVTGGGVTMDPFDPEQGPPPDPGRISVENGGSWSSLFGTDFHPIEVPFENVSGNVAMSGFDFQAGYLQDDGTSFLGAGVAKVENGLTVCGGTLDLGTGVLMVDGDADLGFSTLAVSITQTDGCGSLLATGTVSFSGVLSINAGWSPPEGTRYTIIQADWGVEGDFNTVTGAGLPNGTDYLQIDRSDPLKFDLVVMEDL